MTFIVWWNVPRALRSPNGMEMNLFSLCCEIKVGFSQSASSVFTCQNSLFLSKVEKIEASLKESIHLFTHDLRYRSRFVMALSSQYSTQENNVPSFSEKRQLMQHFPSVRVL